MALKVPDGQPVRMTMKFWDVDDEGVSTPADPTEATLHIQKGYSGAPTPIDLSEFTHVATGVFTYKYETAGLAPTDEVEIACQVETTLGITSTSDPASFTVVPKRVSA